MKALIYQCSHGFYLSAFAIRKYPCFTAKLHSEKGKLESYTAFTLRLFFLRWLVYWKWINIFMFIMIPMIAIMKSYPKFYINRAVKSRCDY